MGIALGLIGFLGFGASLIILIIYLIKRKKKRNILFSMLGCFLLFMIGIMMFEETQPASIVPTDIVSEEHIMLEEILTDDIMLEEEAEIEALPLRNIVVEYLAADAGAASVAIGDEVLGIQSTGTVATHSVSLPQGNHTIEFTVDGRSARTNFDVIETDLYYHFIFEVRTGFLASNRASFRGLITAADIEMLKNPIITDEPAEITVDTVVDEPTTQVIADNLPETLAGTRVGYRLEGGQRIPVYEDVPDVSGAPEGFIFATADNLFDGVRSLP